MKDWIIRIVLMIGLLVCMLAAIRAQEKFEFALNVIVAQRYCLQQEMTVKYCDEFVMPMWLEAAAEDESRRKR